MSCSHAAAHGRSGSAENGCQAAGPVGDALNVRPAAGEPLLEESPGELLRP